VTTGNSVCAIGSNAGLTLLIDSTGNVYESTDGGQTWALLSTVPIGTIGGNGNLVFGNGVWLYGSIGTDVARSTDNGATWTDIATGIVAAGNGWIATDGAGNWIIFGNIGGPGGVTNNYAVSADDGVTWTLANTFSNGGAPSPPLWNGALWVVVVGDLPNGADTVLATSADGQTYAASADTNDIFAFTLLAGVYFACNGVSNKVRHAASVAALQAAATVTIAGLSPTGNDGVLAAAGRYFVFDDSGGVANSTDASIWEIGTQNFAATEALSAAGAVAYDTVNDSYIVGGNLGTVCTYP
jgi:hypothetical protein